MQRFVSEKNTRTKGILLKRKNYIFISNYEYFRK